MRTVERGESSIHGLSAISCSGISTDDKPMKQGERVVAAESKATPCSIPVPPDFTRHPPGSHYQRHTSTRMMQILHL